MTLYTEPFRLRVLKALSTALEDVCPNVFRGRLYFGDSDPLPCISILEAPVPLEQLEAPLSATASSGDWVLLVQGFVKDDKKNPTDPAQQLLAATKKRLMDENKRVLPGSRGTPDPLGFGEGQIVDDKKVGNAITKLLVGPGVVRPPEDGISSKAYFWLTLTLKIVEDISRPFE
jgi:hypothetical protein